MSSYRNITWPPGRTKKAGWWFASQKRTPFTLIMIVKDKGGRYVMAVGRLHDQLVSFISYYAPNTGQVEFFSKMLRILIPKAQGQVIMGGDSNVPLDRIMDKSDPVTPILKLPPNDSGKIACLLHLHDLIDAWREIYPTARDYTYFSQVHCSYYIRGCVSNTRNSLQSI